MMVRDRVGHGVAQALSVVGMYEGEEPIEIDVLGVVDTQQPDGAGRLAGHTVSANSAKATT
jgi:hypothetical protein